MASQPPVLALRQWNCSRSWGQLKRWSRHTHRCCPPRDQDLPGHFVWVKSCVNVPNLRRNLQPNGAFQNHNTETRGAMLSCVASTSFAAKVRLVSFIPSISSVPFRKKGRGLSRPARRSRWMVGRKKKRRKNGQHQPLGVSWSDCTWFSETPYWCAWLPFPSFLNSTWRRKTLTLSMIGSMDLSWGAIGLPLRSRRCSWQSVMHGERFMSRCMVACISKKLLTRSKTTACFGWEKSMKESSPKGPKVNQRKAKIRRAHGGTPSANLYGRRKERAMETKEVKEKGKGSQDPQTGRRIGFSRIQRVFPFAETISSRRLARTFSQLSSGELGRLGLQCRTQRAQARELPSQGLKRSDGCWWRCGASWKPRGRQRHSGWHWCRRHTVSIHSPETGGAPDLSKTSSPHAPNLALGTAADGAVAPTKEGVHLLETGGSPAWDEMIPTLPWVRLPMALKPFGRPEFIPSGCDLRNLLPLSLGSQPSIPTWQSVALVKKSLSKTKCPVVRNSVKPIRGWDTFQIDWGKGFYLQWPKRPSTQDQYWCFSMLGRMIHFPWTVVFTPIIHGCRYVVAFDTRRSPQPLGHDLLEDQPYVKLCQAAIEGRVRLVCGGPNCRTWSILRWFPKPKAPASVRGGAEDLVWGLSSPDVFDNIDETELLSASFLEHPRDPVECSSSASASRCSSLWATKMFKAWYPTVGHTLVKFDQCRLGQLVPKPTCFSSDLAIQCWDGLSCNHPPYKLPEDMQSSDLSRYPPSMMQGHPKRKGRGYHSPKPQDASVQGRLAYGQPVPVCAIGNS